MSKHMMIYVALALLILVACGIIGYFVYFTHNSPSVLNKGYDQNIKPLYDSKNLIGSWSRSIADPTDPACKNASKDEICFPNDTEEWNFAVENGVNIYHSYEHSQPELENCTWKLEGNTLNIACGSISATYPVTSLTSTTLTVLDGDQSITFKKI